MCSSDLDVLPLAAVVFAVLVLVTVQSLRRRRIGEMTKALAWAAGAAALLLALVLALFPFQKHFNPPVTWEELYEKLDSIGQAADIRSYENAGLSGNPNDVELARLRALPSYAGAVMTVHTDYTGLLYLRGSSYDLFDGAGWARDQEQDWDRRLVYPYLGTEDGADNVHTLRITPLTSEEIYYTAYELLTLPGGKIRAGSYLENSLRDEPYVMTFSPKPAVGLPGRPGLQAYEAYVQETCLSLPQSTREGLLEWWSVHGNGRMAAPRLSGIRIQQEGDVTWDEDKTGVRTAAFAGQVADAVSRCASYSRNPDRLPAGRDFCTWFLNDAEQGYCVHYASCCAALLRALGIPARYVSGFVCRTEAGGDVTVTNLQAHAWVEYYDLGAWHLLEPTPGDATEFTGRLPVPASTQEVPQTETDYVPATRPVRPVRPQPEPTMPTDEPPVPTQTESGQALPGPEGGGSGERAGLSGWLWAIPAAAAAAAALAVLRRHLAARRRAEKLRKAGPNEKAVLLYRRAERLYRLSWIPLPEDAARIGKKAAFSQHTVTGEELEFLRQCVDRQLHELERAPLHKKLWHRYILAAV